MSVLSITVTPKRLTLRKDYPYDLLCAEDGSLLFTENSKGLGIHAIYFDLQTVDDLYLFTESNERMLVRG